MKKREPLMGTADVARRLGLTPKRVQQLADLGRLLHRRTVSGVRLYRACDVEAYIAKWRTRANAKLTTSDDTAA